MTEKQVDPWSISNESWFIAAVEDRFGFAATDGEVDVDKMRELITGLYIDIEEIHEKFIARYGE